MAKRSEKQKDKKRKSTGRFKTGAIFGAIVLACLLISDITTVILIVVLAAMCCYELCALLRSDAKLPNEWIGVVGAALYPIVFVWIGYYGILLLTLMIIAVVLGWYVAYPRARITDAAITVFSSLYTGLMLTSIVMIRLSQPGIWGGVLATIVIFAIWGNDTMAFVWGSRLGRHRMAPRISPKKSWEGCAAGLVGSTVIWVFMCFVPGVNLPLYAAIISGLV
ncbi:MAG: phosphatidate cytidylyltransferase, partial [Coriobacteriales bacterium]